MILERLRPLGYTGGITVLKQRVAKLRPVLRAAKSYQRTSYLPGEIAQLDWWHTGVDIPVGKGAGREAFGLVTTLPQNGAESRQRRQQRHCPKRRGPSGRPAIWSLPRGISSLGPT